MMVLLFKSVHQHLTKQFKPQMYLQAVTIRVTSHKTISMRSVCLCPSVVFNSHFKIF